MTTIATDGKTIAADSQRTAGSERIDLCSEKIIVRDGHVFAFTGTYGYFAAAIRWFLAGADPEKAPKVAGQESWRLIVIGADCKLMCFSDAVPFGELFPYPQAFGSGCNYATAALMLGKSPAEAIELAKSLDVYTDGPVQVVDIAAALGAEPMLAAAE